MNVMSRAGIQRQRWLDFTTRVLGRAREAVAELSAEHHAHVERAPSEHGAISARLQAGRMRVLGLGDKLDEAFDALDAELDLLRDEASDADDDAELDAIDALWATLARQRSDSRLELELEWTRAEARLEADHARALRALDSQGNGVHALAHEAALGHRLDELRYQHALERLRHPTSHDRAWVTDARARYWRAYYEARNALDAAQAVDVEASVQNRLQQADAFGDPPIEQQKRAFMAELVVALHHGQHAAAAQCLAERPHHVSLDDCAEALAERQMSEALRWMLARIHAEEAPTEALESWLAERSAELARTVRGWV